MSNRWFFFYLALNESTKYRVFKAKIIWKKMFHSINIVAYYKTTLKNVASTINNQNAQAKGKFQV